MNLEIDYLWSHKCPKKWDQYTLIALVITIIVLLILAGVTIVTLTGDNGLLQKAKTAVDKNSDGEIKEQIKLAYGEYQVAKYDNTDKTAEKIIEHSLKTKYNENITKVEVKNEKVIVDIKVNNVPKTYIYKANIGEAYEYEDPFDYGEKEKKDIDPGDDISVGTEKFKVFYNKDGVIKAMSYYNLVTETESGIVKQGPAVRGKSTDIKSSFATELYWNKGEDSIDISDPRNNIQQYITAYTTTLEELGVNVIEVRLAKYSELSADGVTETMRVPEGWGGYWLASGDLNVRNQIICGNKTMKTSGVYYLGAYDVRPIIIINYFN